MASKAFPLSTNFDPAFGSAAEKLRAAAAAAGIQTHYESGVRSKDDQAQLYANWQAGKAGRPLPFPDRGRVPLAAVPGTSLHERGLAADIVADNPADQAKLRSLGGQFGLKTLGARDPNHFELASIPKGGGTPGTVAYGGGGPPIGTTINAANAPIAGGLAKPEVGPEAAGSNTPVAASTGPLDTRQLVYNKLVAAGLQPHQALGALYSLGGESHAGLDTTAYNPKDPGGAIGIGQWNRERRTALEAFAKARGTTITDPNTQSDYLVDELTNANSSTYQPGVLAAMQKTKTAAEATNVWTAKFERPKVNNWQQRFNQGSAVGTLDDNNQFVLGTGKPSNTSGTMVAAAPGTQPSGPVNTSAAPAAPADQGTWWQQAYGKIVDKPVDAQGNPTGKPSPMENIASAFEKGPARMKALEEDQAPESVKNYTGTAPPARNVSPGLANVSQTYGQTLNSFSQPLTWNDAPPQAPQMPAGGFRPAQASQGLGVSLNSVQPSPYGVGYGIPSVGFGYG